jgi:hypothetical protein
VWQVVWLVVVVMLVVVVSEASMVLADPCTTGSNFSVTIMDHSITVSHLHTGRYKCKISFVHYVAPLPG